MEELLQESQYQSNRAGPWDDEVLQEEWNAAKKAGVKRLYWDRKYISEIPKALIRSNKFTKGLRVLSLSVNQLSSLPDTFSHFKSLQELDLSSNKFEEFPMVLLKMGNLQKLNMERNQLKTLPKSFSQLERLTSVSFFGNHIETLEDDTFEGMTALREVDLECNHIRMVPQSLVDLQSTTENFLLKTDDMSNLPPEPKKTRKRTTRTKKPKNPPAKRQRRK